MPYLIEYGQRYYMRQVRAGSGALDYSLNNPKPDGHRFATKRSAQCFLNRMIIKHNWDLVALQPFKIIEVES